jgi:hypothetical protein
VLADIITLKKYVVTTEENFANEIHFSSDYEFQYFDLDQMDCKKIKTRPENIFKINFHMIGKKLRKYFPKTKININFEASSENDTLIKKNSCTYKHDVCIKLTNQDNETYDIGLEYFEFIHDRIKDDDKEISSKVILDGYYVYHESSNNFNEYMRETIYNIMITICTIEDDPYILSKINFFNNYKNIRSLKSDTVKFNNIMKWKRENIFNFKKIFEIFVISNPDTGLEYEFEEFIKHIDEKFKININFLDDKSNCEYKYFVDLIVQVDASYSSNILTYRKIYTRTMDVLIDSQKQMIKWIKQMNNSRKLIPQYLDSFLRVHIQNYRYTDTQFKALNTLQNKLKK